MALARQLFNTKVVRIVLKMDIWNPMISNFAKR
jgi:hypothetical protein